MRCAQASAWSPEAELGRASARRTPRRSRDACAGSRGQKGPDAPHVDVRPSLAGPFAEVALRALRVVGPPDEPLSCSGSRNGPTGSRETIEIWTSMIGLATRPGTRSSQYGRSAVQPLPARRAAGYRAGERARSLRVVIDDRQQQVCRSGFGHLLRVKGRQEFHRGDRLALEQLWNSSKIFRARAMIPRHDIDWNRDHRAATAHAGGRPDRVASRAA